MAIISGAKPSEDVEKVCLIRVTVKTKLAKIKNAIYTQKKNAAGCIYISVRTYT